MKTVGELKAAIKDIPDDTRLAVDLWDEQSGDGEFHDIVGCDYNEDASGCSLMVKLPSFPEEPKAPVKIVLEFFCSNCERMLAEQVVANEKVNEVSVPVCPACQSMSFDIKPIIQAEVEA